jgi:hypothetical protein
VAAFRPGESRRQADGDQEKSNSFHDSHYVSFLSGCVALLSSPTLQLLKASCASVLAAVFPFIFVSRSSG